MTGLQQRMPLGQWVSVSGLSFVESEVPIDLRIPGLVPTACRERGWSGGMGFSAEGPVRISGMNAGLHYVMCARAPSIPERVLLMKSERGIYIIGDRYALDLIHCNLGCQCRGVPPRQMVTRQRTAASRLANCVIRQLDPAS